jgi:hypothetical protein
MLLFVLFAAAGCEEYTNSAEKSSITYLPVIEVIGETDIELPCDATGYEDEGAVATEGGEVIEHETVLTGQYFGGSLVGGEWVYDDNTTVSGPDVYEYTYSASNVDGIPAVAFREVFWPECNGDLSTSIAGTYTSSLVRTLSNGTPAGTYTNVGPIIIKDLGNDVYQISDALGGWYAFGRAFGYTGAAPGMTITANNIATNDFTFGEPVYDQTFGGLVTMTELTVNAGAGTLVFKCDWDLGYKFVYTLTPID